MNVSKTFNLKLSVWLLSASVILPATAYAEVLDFKMCVDKALTQNPEMAVSSARIDQAEAALNKAESSRLPQINLSVTAANSTNALTVFGMKLQQQSVVNADFMPSALNNPDAYTDFNTRIEMLIPVWNGGKIGHYEDQAAAMIQAAREGDLAVQQFLTYNVYQAYDAVHAARAYIHVAEQAKRTADAFVKTTQNLVNEGVVVRSELLSAKVHQTKAEVALLKAKSQEGIALDSLRMLMGSEMDAVVKVADRFSLDLPADSIEALLAMGEKDNPELAAKRKEADSAVFAKNAERSALYPSFNVMVRQDWNDEAFSLNNGSYTLAGVVSWKITDFGVTRSAVDMANASAVQQKSALRSAENNMRLNISSNWRNMQVAEKQVKAEMLAVKQASEARDLIVKRYKAGLGTMTEVLASQTQVDKTQAELVSAEYDVNMYRAKLRLATGTMDVNLL